MRNAWLRCPLLMVILLSGVSCTTTRKPELAGVGEEILISVKEQKMALIKDGKTQRVYDVSTSKYGLGDSRGSYKTPTGRLQIARKIGDGSPAGAVFKSREPTGEILPPNSPGRDPVVSRILWLKGLEAQNQNAYGRYIYIHGTPEEQTIGKECSFGCIRMRSNDVIDLYSAVSTGALVHVSEGGLGSHRRVSTGAPRFHIAWRSGQL